MARKPRTLKPVHCEPLRAYHRAHRGLRDGRRYWQVMWHEGGDSHSVQGASGWYTRAEVARAMAERVAAGDYGGSRPDGTVDGLLDAWLGHCAQTATNRRTLRNQANSADRLLPHLGAVRVDRLTTEIVADAARALSATYADSTVDLTMIHLGAAWRWGRSAGLTPDHPLTLPKPKPKAKRVRAYNRYTPTGAEVAATIDELPDDWRRLVVELLWATGARIGEVSKVGWDAFDLGERPALLVGVRSKTGARRVPLNGSITALLRATKARTSEHRYWHGHDRPAHHTLHQALSRACDAAEVPRWTPHGLRRLALTDMCLAGVPVHVAAAIAGNSGKMVLEVYAQVRAENAVDAVAVTGRGTPGGPNVIPMRGQG